MAQRCDICGKEPAYGNNVSHSHTKTRRRWIPNIQKIRISVNGTPMNARVCTQCIKSGKIVKAV